MSALSPVARGLVIAAAAAVLVLFVRAAAPVIAPVLLAAFLAIVLAPAVAWLRRQGLPKYAALVLVVLLLAEAGGLAAVMVASALEGLQAALPAYLERLALASREVGGWLETIGLANARDVLRDVLDPAAANRLVRAALAGLGSFVATGVLALLATVFMLMEAPGLGGKLRLAFGLEPDGEARLAALLRATHRYLLVKCLTSLMTGLCLWIWLRYLNIDFAILWAFIAVFLNFIPYVGTLLMTVPAGLMALAQAGPSKALLVVAGYVVVNTAINSILEPQVLGRGLGLSPLAIFLSLLVWGWLLGIIGAFLAVPLTMALYIALDASPHTRGLAVMLEWQRESGERPRS